LKVPTRFLSPVTAFLGLLLLCIAFLFPLSGSALAATNCLEKQFFSTDFVLAKQITHAISLSITQDFDIPADIIYIEDDKILKICIDSSSSNNSESSSKAWIALFFDLFCFFTFHFVMLSLSRIFFIGF
jgi:hypothetical protein